MKQIEVVAAIIRKGDKIFATQRGYGEWKDWWEFPGGKMEARNCRRRSAWMSFCVQWSMIIRSFILPCIAIFVR